MADTNAGDPVTETGVNPGNTPVAGDPSATGNVLTNDTDVDSGAADGEGGQRLGANVGQPVTGTYGSLTINVDGSWTYTLDNGDPDTEALAQGQTVTDVFTYTVTDTNGATSSTPHHHHHRHQRCAGGGGRRQRRRPVTESASTRATHPLSAIHQLPATC